MTDLEYDLHLCTSFEWGLTGFDEDNKELDYERTANNLSKIGYQKIVWHDVKKELPERLKYVLGDNVIHQTFVIAKRDWCAWFDANGTGYNVDYWAELPKINLER